MKQNQIIRTQIQLPAYEINFVPSPDEVARRAYFSYENQGGLPGRDVQHWLAAEAELVAERKLIRTHQAALIHGRVTPHG